MRIASIRLRNFKRFNDLTINLTNRQTKIVALVGPNGSGKSSVLDGFEEFVFQHKSRGAKQVSYYKKSMFTGEREAGGYNPLEHVSVESDQKEYDRRSVYIRSAYRFTPRLGVAAIRQLPDADDDGDRPQSLIDQDPRLMNNYERLIGRFFGEVYGTQKSGKTWEDENISALNAILSKILDIRVSYLGNPVDREGSLYFDKGASTRFPYENLSAGEKEVVDLILDMFIKKDIYTNSIICIDEPELHLNTAIQRELLVELEKLVPETSQLWIATHSIGFLRALQEDLWDKTAVIDFTGTNFDEIVVLAPVRGTRSDWTSIFATALDDLTGLLAPNRIIYCEGREDAGPGGLDLGLDAEVLNRIFAVEKRSTLFVSSGGGGAVKRNAALALMVLKKALGEVEFLVFKDRDECSEGERAAFLRSNNAHRMGLRREIENYLFDREILEAFCVAEQTTFDLGRYLRAVHNINEQDLKKVQQEIQASCGTPGSVDAFKRRLSDFVTPKTAVFAELSATMFGT